MSSVTAIGALVGEASDKPLDRPLPFNSLISVTECDRACTFLEVLDGPSMISFMELERCWLSALG